MLGGNRRKSVSVFLFLILSSVLVLVPNFAVNAEPNTSVVPDDYSTIQEAINNAVDGDTVFVKSGVYYEYLVVNKSISLVGENKETTTIYRGNQSSLNTFPTVVVRKDGVNITGFTIKNDLDYPTQINIDHFPGAIMSMTGIHLISVRLCNIFGNIITDSGYGIWLYDSRNNSISDNKITNSNHGVLLHYSLYNFIHQNTVTSCSRGLVLSSASLNIFRDNNLMNSSRNFEVSGNSMVHYSNDVDSSNLVNGKRLYYLFNLTNEDISGPNFQEAGLVYVVNCNEMTFRNLDVSNDFGFFLFNTTNSTIVKCKISNTTVGIWLKSCSGIILSENFLTSLKSDGIRLESSERMVVKENSVEKIRGNAIRLSASNYCNVTRNLLKEIVGCGTNLVWSSNNNIVCNELNNSEVGIALVSSPENRIESNIIYSSNFETANLTRATKGISVARQCDNTTITGNMITNCEWGIILEYPSYYIFATGNSITACNIGLQIRAYRSTFTANTISYSGQFAVSATYGLSNLIYNNNFIKNSQQVHPVTVNFWDNGINGNYWSNYTGTDNDGDGIGDTSHILDYRNQDNCPLIVPVKTFDAGTWEWTDYKVDIISNSNISNLFFNPEGKISFSVDGETAAPGFCRVTIPKGLLDSENNWAVFVDDTSVLVASNETADNYFLNFTYNQGSKTVEIIGTTAIPEFSSWLVLPMVLVASLLIVFCKKKLKSTVKQSYL